MAIGGVAAMLVAYLLVAYFFIPEIWIHRDAGRIGEFGPMVTTTEQDIPGDPINVGLVGSKEDVLRAFASAGWDPADKITLRTSAEIGLSVVLDRPDLDAPVSALLFEGRKQDLAFERAVGKSADERHHVRFWLTRSAGADGRPHAGLNCIWIGAATPVQKATKGPAGIIGPDGNWVTQCPAVPEPSLATAVLDRDDPVYDIPLQKARPWRLKARQGDIYRERMVDNARSENRSDY
ncbi:LssY C-terminal domain-containing protein [Rhizobium sp. T1470]|uniref:LssY C-terminal domain-containing protein n=1 Tax=unclassified Rhizobium TaxID=2613769 RepID=UPI001CD400E8|nr:LssY C-terminal domain-containing protein [Rhizobium sp. T1473]MCA0803954.1 LssY C-terminal domain-containing protein [Rhizobium sp. T1473]